MKLEIYEENHSLKSTISEKEKSRNYNNENTINFLKDLPNKKIGNVNLQKGTLHFILKTENPVSVIIYDYAKIKSKNYFDKINKEIERQNNKLKQGKKINRRKSLAIGTSIVILGVTLISAIAFPKEGPIDTSSSSKMQSSQSSEMQSSQIVQSSASTSELEEGQVIYPPVIDDETNYKDNVAQLSYEDRSNTDKVKYVRENYGDLITKYATMYGVDPNIMIAIATQEKGFHSDDMSGPATGLMQIENDVWINNSVEAYNFETEEFDKIKITEDNIGDLNTNIQVACMIFDQCLSYVDFNPLAAIQCYNMGMGNIDTILAAYSKECGLSRKDILSDVSDIGWCDYRDIIDVGNDTYLEDVLSWLGPNIKLMHKDRGCNDKEIIIEPVKENIKS